MSSARFVRQVDAALKPVLAEGDRWISGARVVRGVPPQPVAVISAVVAAFAGGAAAVLAQKLSANPLEPSPWLAGLLAGAASGLVAQARVWIQRPTFLAVSRQQLICAGLTVFRQRPVRIVAVPLSAAAIDRCSHGPRTTSITLRLPGRRPLRLHGFARRQPDLDLVLYWAQLAGVPVSENL